MAWSRTLPVTRIPHSCRGAGPIPIAVQRPDPLPGRTCGLVARRRRSWPEADSMRAGGGTTTAGGPELDGMSIRFRSKRRKRKSKSEVRRQRIMENLPTPEEAIKTNNFTASVTCVLMAPAVTWQK